MQTLSEPCNLWSNWRVNMFTSGQAQEVSLWLLMFKSCVGVLGRNGELKGISKAFVNWGHIGPSWTVRHFWVKLQESVYARVWPHWAAEWEVCILQFQTQWIGITERAKFAMTQYYISWFPPSITSPMTFLLLWLGNLLFIVFSLDVSFLTFTEVSITG